MPTRCLDSYLEKAALRMTFQGWSGTTFEKSVQATAMKLTILVLTGVLFAGIVLAEVSVQETEKSLVVTNAHSQLTIHQKEEGVGIVLSARDGGALTPLCRSFKPDPTKRSSGNKLFDTTVTPHRFQAAEMGKRHVGHNPNLEIEGALPVACGRPLTLGDSKTHVKQA